MPDPRLPDSEDAATADDLVPEDPPGDTPVRADRRTKTAVKAPVNAHGEMASAEQLAEGERAVDAADSADE